MNRKFYAVLFALCLMTSGLLAQVNLSGKVLRHNGSPMVGITVSCTDADDVVTDAEGNFEFVDLPSGSDYLITAVHETTIFEDVTILDIVLSRHSILSADNLELFQAIASDMNQSGSLTTFDLVFMDKTSLKIPENSFPSIYWSFFNSESTIFTIEDGIQLNNVTSDINDLELVGVKLGDPALDEDHMNPPADAPVPNLYIEPQTFSQGESALITIKVEDFQRIGGFQHVLKFNSDYLAYTGIFSEQDDLFVSQNDAMIANGELLLNGLSFSNTDGLSLNDDEELYAVQFNVLQDIDDLEGLIQIDGGLISNQMVYVDFQNELHLIESTYNEVPTNAVEIENLKSFEILPNPAHEEVFVKLKFDQVQSANLDLLDINGRVLQNWDFNAAQINQRINLNIYPVGTYLIQVQTESGVSTQRIIKQ